MIVPKGSAFTGVRSADLTDQVSLSAFQVGHNVRTVIRPGGTMKMPPVRVVNRNPGDYQVRHYNLAFPGGQFPTELDFPPMVLTQLDNAWCSPLAPPVLPGSRRVVTDYLMPWEVNMGGFDRPGDNDFDLTIDLDTDQPTHDFDTALYLDSPVSKNFGHFISDCLSRMYVWPIVQRMFGAVKVIIGDHKDTVFQNGLLEALDVPRGDFIKISGLAHCRRLLLATPALGLARYATPTATGLWTTIRNKMPTAEGMFPPRIYLSRMDIAERKLVNEPDVEDVFKRNGFAIIEPEKYSIQTQVALASNAEFIAGPSGSSLFSLAFQGRLKSVLVLTWAEFMQPSEMLVCAGHNASLYYHLGRRVDRGSDDRWGSWHIDIPNLECDVAKWIGR